MPKCSIKRGFLILHECGQETSKLCGECGRPACEEHLVMEQGGWTCVDCHGKRMQQEELDPEQAGDSSSWRHGYRDRYYHDHTYAPYLYGAYYSSYYDDYDTRAFDRELTETGELPEDDGSPDFVDS